MADALPDPPTLDAASVASAGFSRSRKGFEPTEVHSLLGRVADALRVHEARDRRLTELVEELTARVEVAENLDEERAAQLLGSETARIVSAARSAAAEIRSSAEEEAATVIAEANATATSTKERLVAEATADRDAATTELEEARRAAAELTAAAVEESTALRSAAAEEATSLREAAEADATRWREEAEERAATLESEARERHDDLVGQAERVLAERTAEAERAAEEIRREAEEIRANAVREADRIHRDAREAAEAEVESARERGREMLAETREVRQKMLRDLAERRRAGRQQIEAARVAREAVVEAIRTAAVRLDDTLGEVDEAEIAARRAGEVAAAAVVDDVGLVVAELEQRLDGPVGPGDAAEPDEAAEVVGAAELDQAELDASGTGDAEADPPASAGEVGSEPEPEAVTAESEPVTAEPEAEESGAPAGAESPVEGAAAHPAEAVPPAAGSEDQPALAEVHDLFEKLRSAADASAGPAEEIDLTEEGSGGTDVPPAVAPSPQTAAAVESAGPSGPGGGESSESAEPAAVAVADPSGREPAGGLLDRRDALLAPAEAALVRTLKRTVSDEQNDVLDRARRHRKGRIEVDDLIAPSGDGVDPADPAFAALAGPFLLAATAGMQLWSELAGTATVEVAADDVRDTLSQRLTALHDDRRVMLRDVLEQFDERGGDSSELVDSLRSAYRELRTTDLADMAGDLANAAFNAGIAVAAKGGSWQWVADNGGMPCSDAEDNALEGAVRCGDPFPTGDSVAPAHPGCRCFLVPVGTPLR